jgi:hypothetical protein
MMSQYEKVMGVLVPTVVGPAAPFLLPHPASANTQTIPTIQIIPNHLPGDDDLAVTRLASTIFFSISIPPKIVFI